ncbi:MAG: hypothetical protein H7287_04790, partial [Thermoleophilia bacterium]|nr:hypothetical protein [Thermoleophilia bacterium]
MKSAISIAALALACTASAAQAASVSTISTQVPGKVPGCEASFDARFDAASLITNNSAMRPDTADGQMREAWRLTPLCEGEDIIIGDGFHIVGPKASGESIPSNVTGLVGETVALSKAVPTTPAGKAAHARALAHGKSYMKQHPHARKNARGSFAYCTITAYSPQWSAGKTRTGG